jgi:hypothetical protein
MTGMAVYMTSGFTVHLPASSLTKVIVLRGGTRSDYTTKTSGDYIHPGSDNGIVGKKDDDLMLISKGQYLFDNN